MTCSICLNVYNDKRDHCPACGAIPSSLYDGQGFRFVYNGNRIRYIAVAHHPIIWRQDVRGPKDFRTVD